MQRRVLRRALEQAGLKSGDVIVRVDGQPVVASGDLPARIGMAKPGDSVKLEVWRQGKAEQLTAQLGGATAAFLSGYLIYALVRPERF